MPSVPSSLSLGNIADGAEIIASTHRNNYSAIQAAVNALQAILADVSAKGDLLVATADDTIARLPVGTNGQVLKANSATGSGLEWGLGIGVSLSTTLPGSPTDGDEVILVDSLSAPTYAWHLKYVSAASTYKWYCIGGTPALIETTTAEVGSMGGTYGDLATVGPSFTLPLSGDWDIEIGCTHINDYNGGAARDSYMSYAIGGTAASDNDAIKCTGVTGVLSFVGTRTRRKTGLASSTALVAKYRYSGGTPTMTWGPRTLRVMPFRVN